MLKGYRTYLFAGLLAIATAAHYLGFINNDIFQAIIGITAGGGLASLRNALSDQK